MAITKLKSGIILDDSKGMAPTLTDWAKEKGLKNRTVFYFKDGKREGYLLANGNTPEFESTRAEDMACHIDMLSIAKKFNI